MRLFNLLQRSGQIFFTLLLLSIGFSSFAFDIDLRTTSDINSSATHRAAPLQIIVFQLRSAGDFNNADYFSLLDTPTKTLGSDLLDQISYTMVPNSHKVIRMQLDKRAKYIGIMAVYENYQNTVWHQTIKLDSDDNTLSFFINNKGISQKAVQPSTTSAPYVQFELGYGFGYHYNPTQFLWFNNHEGPNTVTLTADKFENPYFVMMGTGYQWRPASSWMNTLGINTLSVGIDFFGAANINSSGTGANLLPYTYENKIISIGSFADTKVSFLSNPYINPFISLGLGLSHNQDHFSRDGDNDTSDEKANVDTSASPQLAYYYGLGLDFPLTKRAVLSVGYQFFNLGNAEIDDDYYIYDSETAKLPITFSQATLNFRYAFGA